MADPPRRGVGVGNAAARIEDVLEIGLQLPPAGDLELVANLQQRFARSHRIGRRRRDRIGIERARRAADPCLGEADADRVVLSPEQAFIDKPRIENRNRQGCDPPERP